MKTRRSALAWMLALASAIFLALIGVGNDIENQLQNMRAYLLEKPASGQIVIVEIDGKSLQALDSWPWPREYYARATEKLSKAGASQIAFDVDFSARSTYRQDQIFAAAIANSEATIILPTFRQKVSPTGHEFVESEPIGVLREHAFIASVNIHPDTSGQLNQYSFGTRTGGLARPSIASMITERSGKIDETFAIDQSIDPKTIPRLSFVDLLTAKVAPDDLAGKKVLIGATAIELGDRYPLRRFGVMPGVVIQAMAAETLLQNSDIPHLGGAPSLLIAATVLLAIALSGRCSVPSINLIALGIGLSLFGLALLLEYFLVATFSNIAAYFFLTAFIGFQKFFSTVGALEFSQFSNEASGLPNEIALQVFILKSGPCNIVTARLTDFRDFLVLTDKAARKDLFKNLSDRLKFLALDERIFHLDSDTIAWVMKGDYADDIQGHFETAMVLFQPPFKAGDTRVKIGATFGISNESVDKSKIAAEQAFAKNAKWAWHDDHANSAIGLKQLLLVDLEEAMQNGDIYVVYQPKWSMKTNELHGFEALVRWQHPVHGLVGPDVFIPLIEKSGRIDNLSLFVLKRALTDLCVWNRQRPGLSCAVNISAGLLGVSGFVQQAVALVEQSELDNAQITFEVTETAALADPELSILALGRIKESGIKISIDDYGTGQSTLSYLQRLPVDEIKIDQSFVKTITTDNANRVMVQSTIEMAHALHLSVVAEGIEDEASLQLLTRLGCDFGQGWHISKPLAADHLQEAWLLNGTHVARMSG